MTLAGVWVTVVMPEPRPVTVYNNDSCPTVTDHGGQKTSPSPYDNGELMTGHGGR